MAKMAILILLRRPYKLTLLVSGGCNLKCQFCQNCEISQPNLNGFSNHKTVSIEKIIQDSVTNKNNIGIAYTYNEPSVWYEFMIDLAIENKIKGLFNVMVSNGYINAKPFDKILELIDAFNIDLKGFDDEFYRKNTKSTLNPVLNNLKKIKESDKHLEITNLVIPNENDSTQQFKDMVYWINDNLGENTVLHLSRYFPNYHFSTPPTSPEKLIEFYNIASEVLNYVYLGNINIEDGSDTFCPSCKTRVIRRLGYSTIITALNVDGNCCNCNYPIDIVI
jgi:pyruvate formate lyase activating enzyme